MSVVKINAIEVPDGAGPELEARFAVRKRAVDDQPGFEGFQAPPPRRGGEPLLRRHDLGDPGRLRGLARRPRERRRPSGPVA